MNETRYTISDLVKKTGLSVHTLRYYEKQGVLRRVSRTPSGRRVYGEDSFGTLMAAVFLKQFGLSLNEIKAFFDTTEQGPETLTKRLEMLQRFKADTLEKLDKWNACLKLADFFINGCQQAIQAAEKGENPDAAFPMLTAEGFAHASFMKKLNGKLRMDVKADVPERPEG